MRIVFNDLSNRYLFRNKYEAIENIKIGIDTLAQLRLIDTAFKLWSQGTISYGQLAPGYYFNQLFHESNDVFDRKYRVFILTILKNFNMIEENVGTFEFKNEISAQCAWAYKNGNAVFSFRSQEEFRQCEFEGLYKGEDNQVYESKLSNVSELTHLDYHKETLKIRKYELTPKHKINYGWGSDMDLTDDVAQRVLNSAIEAGDESKHLIAKYNGKFYSFRCHYSNCYHGYPDESMPENLKRKVEQYLIAIT